MKAESVEIDGLKVKFRSIGKGRKKVLFLSGLGMGSSEFDEVMKLLVAKYNLVAMDLPGMEGSEPLHQPSLSIFADVVEKFVMKIGWARFTLIGHSTGGVVAALFAISNPGKVEKLILSSTPLEGNLLPTGRPRFLKFLLKLASSKLGWEISKFLIMLRYRYSPDRDVSKLPRKIREAKLQSVLASDKNTLLKIAEDLVNVNLIEQTEKIKVRTLIIEADSSVVVKPVGSKNLASLIIDSKLVTINDCGHSIPYEEKGRFAEEIARFVG